MWFSIIFESKPISLVGTYLLLNKIFLNCVSRLNKNFDVKMKISDRAHCKNENMGF
jgi:hypothetical protein